MEGKTISKLLGAAVLMCLAATAGCSLGSTRAVWRPPQFAIPEGSGTGAQIPSAAETAYAIAVQVEAGGTSSCVDFYYQAALHAASDLEQVLVSRFPPAPRLVELNRSAVAKLLITAQRHGRWNPDAGLTVWSGEGPRVVPLRFHGFVWQSCEFQSIVPVGDYVDPLLSRRIHMAGVGVPVVVIRHTTTPQPFTQVQQSFAATVLLRPSHDSSGGGLEFYDPLRVSSTHVAGRTLALARDLSAPFALVNQRDDRSWLNNFLRPGANGSHDGLFMMEPYQCGKIPVVFVHGLLSDTETWLDMVNEFRARPGLNDCYQWWFFGYASGEPFLKSAAVLRAHLAQIRAVYDPTGSDPALSNVVLVGHSMGGLISKLQVTESGDRLWRSMATQPVESIRASTDVRQRLEEAFFFSPSRDVKRVVFIGTPHLGSSWARRPVGRLASALVETAPETQAQFQQLRQANPYLFRDGTQQRFPTSIDLMEPSDPLLTATATLPLSSGVTLHSIVGVARTTWSGELSDGVVPVSSARLDGAATERDVDEIHTRLHRHADTVQEVECILRRHGIQTDLIHLPDEPARGLTGATRGCRF